MSAATELAQLALLGEAVENLQTVSAVFVWDDDRNYVAVNQAACTLDRTDARRDPAACASAT